MQRVMKFLVMLGQRQDLALVMLLMVIIAVMIMPLPTMLMDGLIAINLSLTVLVLMVSIYLTRAEDFSVFPTVILLATTFRLAISISTTRLILSQADAGQIIETFGTFVTQGSVVVGLVIFVIITTVQFIVVTKGAERVAEVAARFTLDAMPGRQMSIDAELRSGDITQEEALEKRHNLEKENKFFGAMDGSMKFVKGDAIAGIIIIIVNLAGGFGIGTVSKGLSAAEAASIYSRLTVGDGLVSQIPALLLAICAGLVITRVTTKDQVDLGTDIIRQLAGSSRTLIIAGIILGSFALVPGFPVGFFLLFSAILIGSGLVVRKRELAEKIQKDAADGTGKQVELTEGQKILQIEEDVKIKPNDVVKIEVGEALFNNIDKEEYLTKRNEAIKDIEDKMGQFLPKFGFAENVDLESNEFVILIEGVAVFSGEMVTDHLLAVCEKEVLELSGVMVNPVDSSWPIKSAFWIAKDDVEKLKDVDIKIDDIASILIDVTAYYLVKNAAQLIGFEHVEHILQLLKEEQPQLAAEVAQAANSTQLLEIIRRLADESVPLYSRRLLFEGLLDSIIKTGGSVDMTEHIRRALSRQISKHFADKDNFIASYVVEPDLDAKLRKLLKNDKDARFLAIDAKTSNALISQIGRIVNSEDVNVNPPVLVTSSDVRPHLKKYLKSNNINIDLIAFQEVASEFQLRPIGTIAVEDQQAAR